MLRIRSRLYRFGFGLLLSFASLAITSGCATFGLSENTEKSLCSDAKMGVAMAQIALPLVVSEAEREYWLKWLAAAEASMAIACVQSEVGVPVE